MAFAVVMVSTLVGCGPAAEPLDTEVSPESQEAALCTSSSACMDLHNQPCEVVGSRTTCCNPSGDSPCRCTTAKIWMCVLEHP
jgi:hypothetical protein